MNIPAVNAGCKEFTAEPSPEKCLGWIDYYASHSLLLGQQEAKE